MNYNLMMYLLINSNDFSFHFVFSSFFFFKLKNMVGEDLIIFNQVCLVKHLLIILYVQMHFSNASNQFVLSQQMTRTHFGIKIKN